MRFFFFGLMRDSDVLELVVDRPSPAQAFPPARLADARLVHLRNETFPMLVRAPGAYVPGVIVEELNETDVARIRFFESVEYEPSTVMVEPLEGGRIEALAFVATKRAHPDGDAWRFEDWVARHKAQELRKLKLWMALFGHLEIGEADRRWDEALAAGRSIEDFVRDVCAVPLQARSSPEKNPPPPD